MQLELHPDVRLQKLTIGREKAPLIVIDNFIARPEQLLEVAGKLDFAPAGRLFPGIRAQAPKPYMEFMFGSLRNLLLDYFQLNGTRLAFSLCHYSIVTTTPEKLELLQRIPHIDSTDGNGLATIHYLFSKNLGGTAFYRHRATGFEYVDRSRHKQYFGTLEKESGDPGFPGCDYINGDTPFFERIAAQEGVFNRILIYRRNSLHSGSIDAAFVPDPNPLTGRLSINSFIDIG
ncbi:MAG TPA: DUF6445 family protein [Gammaproteobacteria bacterium]|nr:DUF6445 family protein [Gammaproteobacteria bacterium]